MQQGEISMADYELIDVYDENGQPTGQTIQREGAFLTEGQFMLYVLAIIQDGEGRYLITQRALDKHWAAGWWEVPGGGVLAGESSEEALRREVGEEVGLVVPEGHLHPIWRYENVDLDRGDNYLVDIYHLHLDFSAQDVRLQRSEAIGAKLVTWSEISDLHDGGRFLHFDRLSQALRAEAETKR